MIVKFFKRGGVTDNKFSTGGESAKNYLLNERVEQGTAQLLKGDPEATTEIINGLGFNKIYTSGCLSFDSEESKKIDDELKQKLMNDFERSLFGDFDRSRISGYWVEHTDKKNEKTGEPRLELNFVFANVDLETGKNLPVYYHRNDLSRINDFKDLTNLTYDLSDPNEPNRKQTSVININQSQNQKDLKQAIDNHLMTLASQGQLPNHDSVKQALTDLGLEITAIKKSSISIKNPDPAKTRPIRLTGAFYEQQYSAINYINRAENSPSPADRNSRIDELSARLESRIAKRTDDLFSRLRPKKGANTETTGAEFNAVSNSRSPNTPTNTGNYQPTNNNNLYPSLGGIEPNFINSDPSLVPSEIANNSLNNVSHRRFIDRILPNLQSPTISQTGINSHDQRNNADDQRITRANGSPATASLSGFRKSISGYFTEFAIRTKASIRLFDKAIASERSSDQQLRNGIKQLEEIAKPTAPRNINKKLTEDPAHEQAPSPAPPFTPPAGAGSEKDNREEVELMEFYGLIPTHDDTPAPAPYSSPKLQDYGLIPPPNANQIIIEGEKNATGKRENNKRLTRH